MICCFCIFVHDLHEMSHFSTALTEIVERSFAGKWAELSRSCGLDASIISRLAAGKFEPTVERLGEIAGAMSRPDRKQLLIAAARDRVPNQFQSEIFADEDPASQILRAKLSPDISAVIRYLESNAMSDESTAAYLRKIGDWVFRVPANVTPMVSPKAVDKEEPKSSDLMEILGGIAAGSPITTDPSGTKVAVAKPYPADHYALQVFGHSMEPKIPNRSIIVVKKWKEGYPKKGTIVVYHDAYGATLKVYDTRKAGPGDDAETGTRVHVLRSLNPEYPDVDILDGGTIAAVFVEVL